MADHLVCVLAADERVPIYHRIGKGKYTEAGTPTVLTFCGRRGDWPARMRLEHAVLFAEPCMTCWSDDE